MIEYELEELRLKLEGMLEDDNICLFDDSVVFLSQQLDKLVVNKQRTLLQYH
jgi:hypothetical protein